MSSLRLPYHRATTANACAIYPLAVDPPLPCRGPIVGIDVTAGNSRFRFDPFAAYEAGLVTNPNMLIAGEPGAGKSTLVKTLAARASRFGDRWIAICDPKGEYHALADNLGLTHIQLRPGGNERLNPLDPRGEDDPAERAARNTHTVTALAAAVLHRPLTPIEDAACGWATAILARSPGEPTLADLAALLTHPTEPLAARANATGDQLSRQVEEVTWAIGKLLDRQLRGMFDGPTTIRLDSDGPGVAVDLSAVGRDPDALAVVMVAATSWLQSALTRPGPPRMHILDEAWALLASERTARWLQACWKLGRAWGVANVAVIHRLSDLRSQADDGTATAKVAAGLLADTQTRVLYRQSADQAADAAELLALTATEIAVLPRLARGRGLWHVGAHRRVVHHHLLRGEQALCDTDQAMRR